MEVAGETKDAAFPDLADENSSRNRSGGRFGVPGRVRLKLGAFHRQTGLQ